MKRLYRVDAYDNEPGISLGQLRQFLAEVDGAPDDARPRVRTRVSMNAQGGNIKSISLEVDDGGVLP